MDLIDELKLLSKKISSIKSIIQTEEATKNAMVMPFIQALGYNVFDPHEVTPELIADVGTKKHEKVDYAILRDGKPNILFECKKCGGDLSINHAGQLFRYFHVTEARIGVLTNGLVYRFFTDSEKPNKMDDIPFFEFNILDFNERDVEELKQFAKAVFDIDNILTTANDLKCRRAIKAKLVEWMTNPPEDIVRLLSADLLGSKRFTPAVRDQFTLIVKYAFEQFISERINERLKGAMTHESVTITEKITVPEPQIDATITNEPTIVTSIEEVEGYHIIKAIVRNLVPTKRVFMRDANSYCAILLDDNNRKTICRLRFNNVQKLKLGLLNDKKEEEQVQLESIDDIYNYADQIRSTVTSLLGNSEG